MFQTRVSRGNAASWVLVVLSVWAAVAGCSSPQESGGQGAGASTDAGSAAGQADAGTPVVLPCATPEDADAAADLEWTAEHNTLEPREGMSFEAWTYNGTVPGPVLRLAVGETRRIKLRNRMDRPVSAHFHGMEYPLDDDGTAEFPRGVVNPGCAHVYTVTARTPGVWPFHPHLDTGEELAHGFYGAIVVPDPEEPPADREFVLFMGQLGVEGGEVEEGHGSGSGSGSGAPGSFVMTFNGRADGRLAVIELRPEGYRRTNDLHASATVGNLVRWRLLNVSPDDWHTFGVHGHSFCDRGGVPDETGECPNGGIIDNIVDLSPLHGRTIEWHESRAGEWMYHCHLIDHVGEGMFATYVVAPQ
ncbi:MAG: multicopper oxidase domain-containing protein [Myxococcota bacterium]